MSASTATDFMFYFFMFAGFLTLIVNNIVYAALGQKFNADDFALKITVPSTLAVLFIGIAFIGLNWNSGDEFRLSLMTIATVIGAMSISLPAIMMSLNRMRWGTPS
jgi:hypothetical protein